MLNWGFGGMFTLNQPSQMQLNFNPPDQFFPVGGCVSITDVVRARGREIPHTREQARTRTHANAHTHTHGVAVCMTLHGPRAPRA